MPASPRAPRIWIVAAGEPLPLPGKKIRLMRAGQIAERLRRRGVDVTWWTSAFDHIGKEYFPTSAPSLALADGVQLELLHGQPYRTNISLARIRNHRQVGAEFARRALPQPRPDAIFCCYPTIDLALQAGAFGKAHDVPVVMDVRDLWPDAFAELLPGPKTLWRLLLAPLARQARRAMASATAITAVSPGFLEWGLAQAGRLPTADDRVVRLAYEALPVSETEIAAAERFWLGQGLKLDGSEHVACFFGTVSTVPEFETAILALEHLPADIRARTRIVICGIGEKLAMLREAAKKYPELLVPGWVDHARIVVLMRHCMAGLLIYPARDYYLTALPNKFGEYISGGLPIISTLPGFVGATIAQENCGIVVGNGRADQLAEAIVRLVRQPETLQAMRANARRVFDRDFNADIIYGDLIDRLLKLAGPANAVPRP